MNKLLTIFLFLLGLFVMFSCEPGRAENGDYLFGVYSPGETGGGNTGTAKQLKSVTSNDGNGEIITFNYTYDSGNLTAVKASDESISYDLVYDGDEISRIKIVQDDGSLVTTSNFDITYEGGKFAKAVGVGTENTGNSFNNTITANYTDNKISKIFSKMVGIDTADPTLTYDIYTLQSDITYSGNNIATWKFSTTFAPPVTLPPIVITSTLTDYDDKKNPFNTLPEAFNIISSLYGFESTAVIGFSANNYRKITVTTGTDTQSANYTYTYDASGYPTKAEASSNLGSLTFEYQ